MPHIHAYMGQISDEALTNPPKNIGNEFTKIQRQMLFEDRIISVGIPAWYASKITSRNTLEHLSPIAAEAILMDCKKGKFRPESTSKLTKLMITGQLQRTARLLKK